MKAKHARMEKSQVINRDLIHFSTRLSRSLVICLFVRKDKNLFVFLFLFFRVETRKKINKSQVLGTWNVISVDCWNRSTWLDSLGRGILYVNQKTAKREKERESLLSNRMPPTLFVSFELSGQIESIVGKWFWRRLLQLFTLTKLPTKAVWYQRLLLKVIWDVRLWKGKKNTKRPSQVSDMSLAQPSILVIIILNFFFKSKSKNRKEKKLLLCVVLLKH